MSDTPMDVARRYFSEEPWWLEKMVDRVIEAHERVVVTSVPERNDIGEVVAMLERLNGGPIEPATESLADYVTVVRNWWIHEDGKSFRMHFMGTHEQADAKLRELERDGGIYDIAPGD